MSSGFALNNPALFRLLNFWLRLASWSSHGVYIGRHSALKSRRVKFGYGTRVNGSIVVKGQGTFSTGRYCAIGDEVRVITSNHKVNVASIQLKLQRTLGGSAHIDKEKINVSIGNDVWIGDRVILLPGVTVGDGAILGAGSIVTRNVEPFTVVAGTPAKYIDKRFPSHVVDAFADLKWWDLGEDALKKGAFLFFHEFCGDMERDMNVIQKFKHSIGEAGE